MEKDVAYCEHTKKKKTHFKQNLFSPPYSNLYQISMTVFVCGSHFFCVCVSENSLPSMLSRHSVFLYVVTVCAGIQLFIYQ